MRVLARSLFIALALAFLPVAGFAQDHSKPTDCPITDTGKKCDCLDKYYGKAGEWVLDVTWTPGFCATLGADKDQCGTIAPGFTLHGLWPQGPGSLFCAPDRDHNVASACRDWQALPQPPLSPDTRADLAAVMPGVADLLDRHEWIKHGTCSGLSADRYFALAASLTRNVQHSKLGRAIAARAGTTLSGAEMCSLAEKALGKKAAQAVAFSAAKDKADTYILTGMGITLAPTPEGDVVLKPAYMIPSDEPICAPNRAKWSFTIPAAPG